MKIELTENGGYIPNSNKEYIWEHGLVISPDNPQQEEILKKVLDNPELLINFILHGNKQST